MAGTRTIPIAAAAVVVAGGAYGFYEWYKLQDVQLTERPLEEVATVEIPQEISQIGLRASVEYATLASLLNDLTSEPFSDGGSGSFQIPGLKTKGIPKCRVYDLYKITCEDTWITGPLVSVGYHWSATIRRNGALQVSGQAGKLVLTVPIAFNGNAGLRGDGAKLLALEKRNFDGALTAIVVAGVDLDENWCPVFSVTASHTWDSKARIEIIDGVNISVSGKVDEMVNKMKVDAERKLSELFTCDDIKSVVAPYWASYTYPIEKIEGLNAHVNAVPKVIAFSGITTNDSGFGIALQLDTLVSLDPTPIIPESLPMPPLKRAAWKPGTIDTSLPISASMADIEALAEKEIDGKDYNFDTPTGAVKMAINTVEVYQSAGRLALGINFVADVAGRIFSASGDAFILATPVINREKGEVYLTDVSFSRALDNDLWEAMSVVLRDRIVSEITSKVHYEFAEDLSDIRKLAFEKMNHPDLRV